MNYIFKKTFLKDLNINYNINIKSDLLTVRTGVVVSGVQQVLLQSFLCGIFTLTLDTSVRTKKTHVQFTQYIRYTIQRALCDSHL